GNAINTPIAIANLLNAHSLIGFPLTIHRSFRCNLSNNPKIKMAGSRPWFRLHISRDCFAFLLRGFIKWKRVLVYPVQVVFLAEIGRKNDQLYAVDTQMPQALFTETFVFWDLPM